MKEWMNEINVICGPPGIGKSTIIEWTPFIIGIPSLDCEDFWIHSMTRQQSLDVALDVIATSKPLLVGGAGIAVTTWLELGAKVIVLTMPERKYLERRNVRDSKKTYKKRQKIRTVNEWRLSDPASSTDGTKDRSASIIDNYSELDVSEWASTWRELAFQLNISTTSFRRVGRRAAFVEKLMLQKVDRELAPQSRYSHNDEVNLGSRI